MKKLIVRTSCLGAGEGRLWWEEVTAFGGQTGGAPRLFFRGRDRAEPVRRGFVLPSELVILVSLQKPLSR